MDDKAKQVREALAQESGGQSVVFDMTSNGLVERMISFVQSRERRPYRDPNSN